MSVEDEIEQGLAEFNAWRAARGCRVPLDGLVAMPLIPGRYYVIAMDVSAEAPLLVMKYAGMAYFRQRTPRGGVRAVEPSRTIVVAGPYRQAEHAKAEVGTLLREIKRWQKHLVPTRRQILDYLFQPLAPVLQ